jgi:hypothetical protein
MLELKNLNKLHEEAGSLDELDFLSDSRSIDYKESIILGYLKITSKEEKRLDLVSKKIYGQHGFLEQIVEFNGILNANDVLDGDIIIIPDIGSMQDNLDIQSFQNKFIESNQSSFSFDGNVIIGNKSRKPNRKVSSKKNFRVNSSGTFVI